MTRRLAALSLAAALAATAAPAQKPAYDLIIRGGSIYDGSGGPAVKGDVAIRAERIACVGACPGTAAKVVDARGKAVAPGFINMLSWSNESLIQDGRGLSELKQGVTLEVMGEGDSMGPLTPKMRALMAQRQSDIKYPVSWSGLDEYLRFLERKGVSVNEMLAISSLGQSKVRRSIAILLALTFSKHFYLVSITSFYIFYLIHTFNLTVQSAQVYLFIFLGAVAAGTVIGGPIGDRIGTRRVIWWSILGVLPFTMMLPYVDLFWTAVLSVIIGVILASAFPAIVVYAQGLIPGRVGMVAGLFFGVAFGIAGIGAAVLGWVADQTSIVFVYHVCAFLPAIGLLAAFLPETAKAKGRRKTGDA